MCLIYLSCGLCSISSRASFNLSDKLTGATEDNDRQPIIFWTMWAEEAGAAAGIEQRLQAAEWHRAAAVAVKLYETSEHLEQTTTTIITTTTTTMTTTTITTTTTTTSKQVSRFSLQYFSEATTTTKTNTTIQLLQQQLYNSSGSKNNVIVSYRNLHALVTEQVASS